MPEYCTYIIDKSTSAIFQNKIFEYLKYDLQRKIVAEAKAEIQVKFNEIVKNTALNFKNHFSSFLHQSKPMMKMECFGNLAPMEMSSMITST